MAGLDHWDAGRIVHGGTDLGSLDDTARALWRRANVGFVFQAFHVLPHLDVAQNVALPLMLLEQHDRSRVTAMLCAVGLDGLGERLPQQLSGGNCSAWPSPARWCTARPAAGRRAHRQPRPRHGSARDGTAGRPDAHAAPRWCWSPIRTLPPPGPTGYCGSRPRALPLPFDYSMLSRCALLLAFLGSVRSARRCRILAWPARRQCRQATESCAQSSRSSARAQHLSPSRFHRAGVLRRAG